VKRNQLKLRLPSNPLLSSVMIAKLKGTPFKLSKLVGPEVYNTKVL